MERKCQIKCKVSEEEKKQIEVNAKKAGFANAASYMRNQCLRNNQPTLSLHQKCEIRDSLQKINELAGDDSKITCYTNKIHNLLDKAGEESWQS